MDPDVNMWASVWHRVEPVLLQLEGSVSVLVVTSASTINERKNRSNESGMV